MDVIDFIVTYLVVVDDGWRYLGNFDDLFWPNHDRICSICGI